MAEDSVKSACSRFGAFAIGAVVVMGIACGASAATDLSMPGPYHAGTRSTTVTRPNGSSFSATVFYPATAAGANAPFDPAAAPCPGITFGHGFLQPVTQYTSTLSHLATHGFIVIASQSEGGLFPNHANFAKDLRFCLDWLEAENANPASIFFASIDTAAFGASGHSMGGGASILAAKDDLRIKALAPTAPADTSPSSIAAMTSVGIPTRLVVGTQDTIVPPGTSAQPMYLNAPGPRQLCAIQGGFHCGFTDASFAFCDSGAITRAQQLAIARRLLTEFFLLHLRGNQTPWTSVWGPSLPPTTETSITRDPRIEMSIAPIDVATPPGTASPTTISITNTGNAITEAIIALDPTAGWTLVPASATTASIAPGATLPLSIGIAPLPGARSTTLLVSARRTADGAARDFVTVAVAVAPALADLDGNGVIDGADLAILLGGWGACQKVPCVGDLNGDGAIDGADLAVLLAQWS